MIKKIALSIAFLIATNLAVFLFIDNKREPKIDQAAVSEIVLETSKLSKNEQKARVESSNKNYKLSQSELEGLVLASNKNYPKTGANGIRIDKLSSGIDLITYHKTFVNYLISDFDESVNSDASRQDFVNEACSNVGTKNLLGSGVSIQVIYLDRNGAIVSDRTVRPKECI